MTHHVLPIWISMLSLYAVLLGVYHTWIDHRCSKEQISSLHYHARSTQSMVVFLIAALSTLVVLILYLDKSVVSGLW